MKISPIQTNFITINANKQKNNKKTYQHMHSECMSYPANYYMTSFKGLNIGKLYEEYNWYMFHDGVSAIKSFLKIKAPQEEMDQFLTHILKTEDRSYELIDSIVSKPRETENILKELAEKIGANSKSIVPYDANSPYNSAYVRYIEKKYAKAHSLAELLKIRPDWSGDALMKKYQNLTHNDKLKIGNCPKLVPPEHWRIIVPYLRDKMEVGLKSKKKIEDLVIGDRKYEFCFFTEGKSSKNVFGVFIPSIAKKYVIKIDDPSRRSLDNPFALGTLAKIDSYLTTNGSRNSAPLCYYNHEENYSIYKYIEHSQVDEPTTDLNTVKKHLPDFRALGLDYNDTVGYKNFFKLDEKSIDTHYRMEGYDKAIHNNEWLSVDNDHVTYNNRLQPSINGYHKHLPNAMGMFF